MAISYPIAGIDIAKDKHDLAVLHKDGTFKAWSIDGDEASLKKSAKQLAKMGVKLVVLESTAGYELPFMIALNEAGVAFARVNAMRPHDFAKAMGQISKTDREDARMLAIYGERVQPDVTAMPCEKQRLLKGLSLRRKQLVEARAKEKTRLKQARFARQMKRDGVVASIEELIGVLDKHVASIEAELETLIENDPELAEKCALVTSFIGIGKVSAFSILAELPELGQCGHAQLNALVGVAPYNDDSAKRHGQRHIKGGRFDLRRALYMGAQTGYRYNPVLKPLYDRLRKEGREHKPAIIACINKTLKILNAMVKSNTHFDPNYAAE